LLSFHKAKHFDETRRKKRAVAEILAREKAALEV